VQRNKIIATGNTTSFCRSEIMAAAPVESGTLILRRLWLTLSYHAPSTVEAFERCSAAFDPRAADVKFTDGHRRRADQSAALPWRRQVFRHVRIADIQGGRRSSPCSCRTSGTAVGLQNKSMQCSLLGRSFARSACKRDGSSGGCG
jgi:hypothetical protein